MGVLNLLGKFNPLGSVKAWGIAIMAVLGVLVKLLYDRGERLEDSLGRANEKVDAAKKFGENRKKANSLSLDKLDDDIRRMFPPNRKRPGSDS